MMDAKSKFPSSPGTPAPRRQRRLRRQAASLFESWLALELAAGRPLKDILADLNGACGTKYKHNWPSVMAGRGYSMEKAPGQVKAYMAHKVLPVLLRDCGLVADEKAIEAIIRCLT